MRRALTLLAQCPVLALMTLDPHSASFEELAPPCRRFNHHQVLPTSFQRLYFYNYRTSG